MCQGLEQVCTCPFSGLGEKSQIEIKQKLTCTAIVLLSKNKNGCMNKRFGQWLGDLYSHIYWI